MAKANINTVYPVTVEYKNKNESGVPKFDFGPVKYNYSDSEYTLIRHDVLDNTEDEKVANDSMMVLKNGLDMSKLSVNKKLDVLDIVLFTALMGPNGKYLKSVGDCVYAITDSNENLTDKNMFKIFRSGDKFVISHGRKYFTVNTFWNRFDIRLEDEIVGDPNGLQHFDVYQIPGSSKLTFSANIKNADCGDVQTSRFLALYNGCDLPMLHEDCDSDSKHKLMANGFMKSDSYGEVLSGVCNNYLFDSRYFSVGNDRYITVGYDGKIHWVKYHNDFYNNFYNLTVDPSRVISDLKGSVLFESPYKSIFDLDKSTLGVDFMTLKNIMTPEYGYTVMNNQEIE